MITIQTRPLIRKNRKPARPILFSQIFSLDPSLIDKNRLKAQISEKGNEVEYGKGKMDNGKWIMENGRWKMSDGKVK